MSNQAIREAAKAAGLRLWQVADALGMADFAFSRKLRKELDEEERARVLTVIEQLKAGRERA